MDKETFELKLYFTTEDNSYKQLFAGVRSFSFELKEHKWVDEITINGRTSEGYLIYFGITDNPRNCNSYRTYNVNWYYVTDDDSESIDEIRFYGSEVNYFYNPARTFRQNISLKKRILYSRIDECSNR